MNSVPDKPFQYITAAKMVDIASGGGHIPRPTEDEAFANLIRSINMELEHGERMGQARKRNEPFLSSVLRILKAATQ